MVSTAAAEDLYLAARQNVGVVRLDVEVAQFAGGLIGGHQEQVVGHRRSLPSEGRLMVAAVVSSGCVTVMVVEPPPSRPMAATQPSSIIRWATWLRLAPMEWPDRRPSMV